MRETMIVMNKRLDVLAMSEIASLFKNCITTSHKYFCDTIKDKNAKLYQFMRSHKERTYKEIEDDSKYKEEKFQSLMRAKEELENHFLMMAEELNHYKR